MTRITRSRPPANTDRLVILNCGIGRDSITMLHLLALGQLDTEDLGVLGPGDLDAVVFSDTGCEWDHTYRTVPAVRDLCDQMGLPFYMLEKPTAAGRRGWRAWHRKRSALRASLPPRTKLPSAVPDWATPGGSIVEKLADGSYHQRGPLLEDYESRATVVSISRGDCTCNHKIDPIRKLMNDMSLKRFGKGNASWSNMVKKGVVQPHVNLIGYAADETGRLATPKDRALAKLAKRTAEISAALDTKERAIHKAKSDKAKANRARAAIAYADKAEAELAGLVAKSETASDKNPGPLYATERFPLVTMGITKDGEQPYLEEAGLDWVRKSGCEVCCYQPPSWYAALREMKPKRWRQVVAYERKAMAANPHMNITGAKLKGDLLTITEVADRWRKANPDVTTDAILAKAYLMDKESIREAVKDVAEAAPVDDSDTPAGSIDRCPSCRRGDPNLDTCDLVLG